MAMTEKCLTQEKVNQAKMLIENFYTNLISQNNEREARWLGYVSNETTDWFDFLFRSNRFRRLEEQMTADGLSEDEVEEEKRNVE